nr:hypothetical protein [Tanacetum cinerariifolium]
MDYRFLHLDEAVIHRLWLQPWWESGATSVFTYLSHICHCLTTTASDSFMKCLLALSQLRCCECSPLPTVASSTIAGELVQEADDKLTGEPVY